MSKQQEVVFNIMVAILQLIPQATLTTVFPISRDIARTFSISDPSILPWLVAAYALSFGTFILVGGRLGDIFGHKNMVVIGYSWISFWSIVAGLSHYAGYQVFFVARGFQGLGASLMVPNGLALLGRTYPPGSKQKVFAFTLFGLCAPVGAYLGMIFGALFTKYAAWWWGFFTLALVCLLLAIAATVVLISPPKTSKQMLPIRDRLRDMDWLGALTGVGGLVCVQVALVSAPAVGWSTQYVYMLLILGLLLIVFFVVVEIKVVEQPLVPFKMLSANVAFVLAAVACGWATFGIWTWFLWKFLLNIRRDEPLEAALQVLPIVPVAFVASALTAWMMRRYQPSWTLFWALVAFTFGPFLLVVDANLATTSYWSWTFLSLVIMPFGMDMSFPAATLIMSNHFPPQQQGVAGSLISTVVNYSISLGLGLASTVEVHVNSHGRNPVAGIRGGWFMGVGLGSLGVIICVAFVVKSVLYPIPTKPNSPPPMPRFPLTESPVPMSPQEASQARKPSRGDTLFSVATTVTPESPRKRAATCSDLEPLKQFQFDVYSTKPLPLPPPPVFVSPTGVSVHRSTRNLSDVSPDDFPSTPTYTPSASRKASLKSMTSKKSQRRKITRKDSHESTHSISGSSVYLHAQSPATPLSPPPTIPLPSPLDGAAFFSESFEGHREEFKRETGESWDLPSPA
jgi:MFS family permease